MTSPYVIIQKLQNKTRMWILEMVPETDFDLPGRQGAAADSGGAVSLEE